MTNCATIANGGRLSLAELPILPYLEFADELSALLSGGGKILAYFATPAPHEVYALLGQEKAGRIAVLRGRLPRSFPSLTPRWPQLHLFEREMGEQFGLLAVGHPWFKPLRFHAVWPGGGDAWGRDPDCHPRPGEMEFYRVAGEEVHEVAVGPVHAGVIEPGHFRFQCFGERVLHLEIALGYQHRGVEKMLLGGPHPASKAMMETIAGDTTIGHMTAYALLMEGLAGSSAPPHAQRLRAIALELERLANHVGDFAALAADVGFLPTAAFCGRLRGDFLNQTAALCGSRLGRGFVRPGGVLFDLDPARKRRMRLALAEAFAQTKGAVELFLEAPSVLSRLEGVGVVGVKDAEALGLVGVGGRASGQDCDVRRHYPLIGAEPRDYPALVETEGDLFARAMVRRREIKNSADFMRQQLGLLEAGSLTAPLGPLPPSSLGVSLVEGWRGRIAHVAITNSEGRFQRYKIVDPSFLNWPALAMAMRDEELSDFPVNNKSFNLSYCGFDL